MTYKSITHCCQFIDELIIKNKSYDKKDDINKSMKIFMNYNFCAGAREALPAMEDDWLRHAVSWRLVSTTEQAGPATPTGLLFGVGHCRACSR